MEIFFTVDDNYKNYLFITLSSLLKNAGREDSFNFHILDNGISAEVKFDIEKLKKIKDFNIDYTPLKDDDFKDYPINSCLKSKVYYYRLKIPSLFPNVKRALFMDTDIIINNSISDLYNLNMEDKIVAFAPNANLEGELQNNRLFLSLNHIYFNAGIMLIDCDKWRKNNIDKKLSDNLKRIKNQMIWADQDLLNVVFENNYKTIPQEYNFWPGMKIEGYEPTLDNYCSWYSHTDYSREYIKSFMDNPIIIHYAGGAKPEMESSVDSVKKLSEKYLKIALFEIEKGK